LYYIKIVGPSIAYPNTHESWSYDDYLPTVLDKILGILGRDVNVQGRFEAALDSIDNVKQAEVEFKLGYIPVKDIGSTYNPLDTENPDIVWETKTFEMKRVDESFIAESEVTTWWPANLLVNFNTLLTGKGLVEYMGQSIFLPEIKTYITGDEPIYIYAEITKIKCIDTKDNYLEFSINKEIPTLYQKVHNAWLEQQLQLQEYQIVSVMCPVNVTITDQYGRTISDNGINGILAANMTLTKEIKIFYLPADLTYSTEVAAYDTGMFNFTKVLPIGTDISITKFENISITASTKAFVEIEPNVINYTMSIDYDGDGEADEVVYPDVNETIEVEQLPTITSVSPTNAATNVPLATTINATFSEAMDTASAEAAFSITPNVAGTFSWIGNTKAFTPTANLASSTTYTVTTAATATDLTGNGLDGNANGIAEGSPTDDYTWSFTTEETPYEILFEDDFSELNPDTWIPFGSPSPRVLASAEGRDGVFDNNGDSWCNSGAVSKNNFSFTNGFTMESDMYLKVTSVAGCWNSPVIGLTRQNTPTGEGVCPTESYPMGVIFGTEYDGDACWATPEEKRRHAYFIIGLYTEEGTWESVSWLNADDYIDAWHNFKIVVGSDRIVKFYVDNDLIYTSEKRINETVLQEKKIFLGIRSSGSAGKSYHDFIKVYATPATIDQILDDFSELNLDTWIPFGSPSPRVLASVEGREGVFDNNGDSWCDSGVVSKEKISLTPPFVIESEMYLKVTDESGCWNQATFGLVGSNEPSGEGSCPDSDYKRGAQINICYVGDACWGSPAKYRRHAYLGFGFWAENGNWAGVYMEGPTEEGPNINADEYVNGWHNYKIKVDESWHVSFYVDDKLIYESEKRIAPDILTEKRLYLGERSSGSAGKSYHDFIKVYATTQENQSPIANFTYTQEIPVVTQVVTFNASDSTDPDGFITEYEWNFGDGNVTNTTEAIINHPYASTGDYTVNLTVTDNDGATNTTTKLITVTRLCGDVAPYPNSNAEVNMGDVIRLLNNVSHPGNSTYTLCNDWAGDCRCTGVRNMGDVVLLLNNVSYPENQRYVLGCC